MVKNSSRAAGAPAHAAGLDNAPGLAHAPVPVHPAIGTGHDHTHAAAGADEHAGVPVHADIGQALALADAYCRERGESLTPLRQKVLSLLLKSGRATKAYTLLDEMRKIHPGSAPPTVYRALDFLQSVGLVHRIESINAFAVCHDLTHCRHGFLAVCQSCGAVAEIDAPATLHSLVSKIEATGFKLASDEVELKGLCGDCARRT
jgi:Fur family zinc uptake transcriptional regulator